MKKLFLTSAALFAVACTTYAQNTATLNQVGGNQSSLQNQIGTSQLSTITQTQGSATNTGNAAYTYQAGTVLNTATIRQINGAQNSEAQIWQGYQTATSTGVSRTNTAIIEQAGDGTAAGVSTGNDAFIYQLGESNLATVLQGPSVTNSTVTIDQLTSGTANEALVLQGRVAGQLVVGGPYDNNAATITQRGTSNKAYMQQIGSGNTVTLTQTGTQNEIRGLAGSPYGLESYAKQIGDNNSLTIIQTNAPGTGGYVQAIEQVGNGNTNIIIQTNN